MSSLAPDAHALLHACPDGIWVLDRRGCTSFANDAMAKMLGVSPARMVGICVYDVVGDDGEQIFRPHLEQMELGRASHEEQVCRLYRFDGTVTWVRVRHAPIVGADGTTDSWLHRVTNLSTAQLDVAELQRREERFKEVQRIARVGSWAWDRASQRLTASNELYGFFGVKAAQMQNNFESFFSRVHPDDQESVQQALSADWKETSTLEFDFRFLGDDGELRWFRSRGQAVRDAEGHVVRLAGTSQDITETKQQENGLAFLGVLGRAANEATSMCALLRTVSELLREHAQWPAVLLSSPVEPGSDELEQCDLGTEEDREEHEGDDERLEVAFELASRAASEGGVVTTRLPGDGTVLVAGAAMAHDRLACVVVCDTQSRNDPPARELHVFSQLLWLVAQVAEREWTASELADARDDALAASRAKSDFLATMSHEIRTPLNGVIGLSELLGSTDLTPHQRRLTGGVVQAGRTLLALVNDILDLSKIEAGRLDLEDVAFDPLEVIEQSVGLVADRALEKNLELAVSSQGQMPEAMLGDPVRFGQVVTNLAANAVKFTSEGEVVVVVSAESRRGDAEMLVEVIDTGIGIESDVADSLFEAFSQADSSTTREYGGTGLGLAISKRIVDAMDGEIGVRSQPGVGSTFWFRVPLRVAQGTSTPDRNRAVVSGLRVLVVDDNETNRLILTEQLSQWQVAVTAVSSSYEALLALDNAQRSGAPYDVMLSDYMMPGTDGEQLARFVRGEARHDRTRLVLLSSATEPTGDMLTSAGIDMFVSKPVLPSRLRDALVKLAGRSPEAVESAGAVPVQPTGRRGRLLVVEDNPVNQMVAEGVLVRSGFEVVLADHGAAALEVLDEDEIGFDAVLMDCQMPVMDGYEATRAIRAREAGGRRMPVLAMTAAVTTDERERCMAAGMDDFCTKPVDLAQLETTLQKWVGTTDRSAGATEPPEPTTESDSADQPEDQPHDQPGDQPAERLDDRADDRPDDHASVRNDSHPVLVRRNLDELLSSGAADTELVKRMIARFANRARNSRTTLDQALTDGDLPAARSAAHDLRGSAATLGLVRLAAICKEIEHAAGEGETPAPDLVARLAPAAAEATRELVALGAGLTNGTPTVRA